MKKILIVLVVLGILAGGFYFLKNKEVTPKDTAPKVEEKSREIVFEKKNIKEVAPDKTEEIDIDYPLISSPTGPADENINKEIKSFVDAVLTETKKNFKEFHDDPYLKDSATPLSLTVEYVVNANTALDVTNVMFEIYTYSGGAHGITSLKYFVFDNKTGKVLTLKDVFVGSNYLDTLSKLSILEIERIDPGLKTYNSANEGTSPKQENFENFVLADSGFKLKFSDYQIGPYVAGRLEIILPYEKLNADLEERFKVK